MCVYGGDDPEWFQAAAESILKQTAPPDEVVLVVDGPVPEELDCVIAGFGKRPEFRVLRLSENRGHGTARRISLENCTHELVALMDADDISVSERFERQLARFREEPGLSIVGGDIAEFRGFPENVVGIRRVFREDFAIKEDLRRRSPMNQVTVMFKKGDVAGAGGYLDWYCEEDYYLWIRMCLKGMKFANVPQVLCRVRVGEELYRRRGGLRYFKSEVRLQRYLLDNRMIGIGTYLFNVSKRLVVQVLLPNRLRGWVFQRFARGRPKDGEKTV